MPGAPAVLAPQPVATRSAVRVVSVEQSQLQVASLAPQPASPVAARQVQPLRPSAVRVKPVQRTRARPVTARPARKARRAVPTRKSARKSARKEPVRIASAAPAVDTVQANPVLTAAATPTVSTIAAAVPSSPARPLADNPRPRYPMLARKRGQQGRVTLRLRVGVDGTASSVQIVASSGVASLDEAARKAVSRWRFAPAQRDGRPRATTLDVPVEFRLDGNG